MQQRRKREATLIKKREVMNTRRLDMKKTRNRFGGIGIVAVLLLFAFALNAHATIDGIEGINFNLTVKEGYVLTPDGGSVYMWGYAADSGPIPGIMQYPGPTLIVPQGSEVTVNLTNGLPAGSANVSMVFPGHQVTATGGVAGGSFTREAPPPPAGSTVTYIFTPTEPGTYTYYSGTNPDLQVEMGLVGAIIVRPAVPNQAYDHAGSYYDHEYLFLLTEIDPKLHMACATGGSPDTTTFFPVYWFINGRNAPETMFPAFVPWLPHQPYNSMPRLRPGEKLLMRVIGGGRDLHPFHHHGNNSTIIARDGRLLDTGGGTGYWPDLAVSDFTISVSPGETIDAIFEWTGKGLGWDIYGSTIDNPEFAHNCIDVSPEDGFADAGSDYPYEYCPDHNKPFPVKLPAQKELTFGGMYSGSPYLGAAGALPPGEGGLNLNGGYFFMWHSHNEKELTNNDIFPGGLMTNCIIEPPGTPIP